MKNKENENNDRKERVAEDGTSKEGIKRNERSRKWGGKKKTEESHGSINLSRTHSHRHTTS